MANPPKQKGTAGETELLLELLGRGINVRRTAPTLPFDLERVGRFGDNGLNVLATRPDRGRWLLTIDLDTFASLVLLADKALGFEGQLNIEVKRYAKFALHTIYESKFGRTTA